MDLSHQVNTIATLNIFCLSNITCINFDTTYYLLPLINIGLSYSLGLWDFIFYVPALLLSMLTHLILSSSLSLSYFILAVPMRKCLGKHSCMSSSFPIVILKDSCFFPTVQLPLHIVYSGRKTRNSCALVNLYL